MGDKVGLARKLRAASTEAERRLWAEIRDRKLGVKFRRQQPIGKYVVDFVCFEELIIVEVDGGQHSESEKDATRDAYFKSKKYRVLRYWNNEVLENTKGVLEDLSRYIPPHPTLSRQGRGNS